MKCIILQMSQFHLISDNRGSPHLHGVFWFEGAPNCENIEEATQEELDAIIEYFNDLISAVNPDKNSAQPDEHPCRIRYNHVTDFQEDLAQLLNTVQRHTECSRDYCIRYNKKTKAHQCRFKFPNDKFLTRATIEKNEDEEMEFHPARNDERLNKYNQFMIQLWRANMDIAPVISKKRLISYLSKYVSKCEISTQSMSDLMNNIISKLKDDDKARRAIQRFFIRSCVERDVCAQEVAHCLLGLKLHSSGKRKFVIINFGGDKWFQLMSGNNSSDSNEEVYGKSYIEKYKDRPAYMNDISLWDAAKYYNMKWDLLPLHEDTIVRVFPRINSVKSDDDNDKFYEQQVFLHVPWRDETTLKTDMETWKQAYERHDIQNKIGCDLLDNITPDISEDDEYDNNENNPYDDETNHEWMILSRSGPHNELQEIELGNRQEDLDYPWMESFQQYEMFGTIEEFQTFIQAKKREDHNSLPDDDDDDQQEISITFSSDQQKVIDLVQSQINYIMRPNKTTINDVPPVKRCIVQGKAGNYLGIIYSFVTFTIIISSIIF